MTGNKKRRLFNIRNKVMIIFIVFVILGLISGTSYAVLKGEVTSDKSQVIRAGSVKLRLTENYESINGKIITMTDEEGLIQEKTYDFNIKNIGNLPAKYDLKLTNEIPSNYTGEVLSDEYLRIGIEINGEEYGPFSLDEVENIIDSNEIYEKEIINYTLRIWLDDSKKEELLNFDKYSTFLTLNVEAEQRSEVMDEGVDTTVLNYTGDVQEYVVPRDGYYYVELAGASGGPGHKNGVNNNNYGLGAKTSGYIELDAGNKLYFYIGGQGGSPVAKTCTNTTHTELAGTGGSGGYNGGGTGGNDACSASNSANDAGGGGGGATDIRLVPGEWNDIKSLTSRIMVAGGGGGGTYSNYGGNGSYLYGQNGYLSSSNSANIATVPTQISGYSFGEGGPGVYCDNNVGSGGHGGGYYGGYVQNTCEYAEGGAGGSSYISGYAGVNSVEESTTITHTNDILHYSNKYFIGTEIIEGENEGNGYAKIVYLDRKPQRKNENLNSVRYIKNCINYNTYASSNAWSEIQAIKDGINIAKGKTVTGNFIESSTYPYSKITDGDITFSNYARADEYDENQCVIVDLEAEYDLDEISVWNYFNHPRRYYDNTIQVSKDNNTWTTIIDEAMLETSKGHRANAYTDIYNGYIQDGLILWYDGYANTGNKRTFSTTTWKNLASSSYSGTLTGGTWATNYLYFDGTDDWVGIASLNLSTPTVEMTFNKTAVTGETEEVMIGNFQSGGYGLTYINEQLAGEFNIGGTYYLIYKPMTLNKKEVLSTSYDQNTIKLYSDGNYYDKKEISGTITAPSNSTIMAIGANPTGTTVNGGQFKGNIHSVRIYDRVLSDEEIYHNYMYDKTKFNLE